MLLDSGIYVSLGIFIGFNMLVILNMFILLIRLKWFNEPIYSNQTAISNCLGWCIFWGKWLGVSAIFFLILLVLRRVECFN